MHHVEELDLCPLQRPSKWTHVFTHACKGEEDLDSQGGWSHRRILSLLRILEHYILAS